MTAIFSTAAFDFLVSCNSQAVPALIKLLKHQDENIRIVAIAILGEIGEVLRRFYGNSFSPFTTRRESR